MFLSVFCNRRGAKQTMVPVSQHNFCIYVFYFQNSQQCHLQNSLIMIGKQKGAEFKINKFVCTIKNFKTYRKRKGKLLPLPVRALTSIEHLPMLTIALQVLGLNWVDSNLAEAQGKCSLGWYFFNSFF